MKSYCFTLLTLVLLFSCKKSPVEHAFEVPIVKDPVVDSLFGELSLEQQYFQHVLISFPEAYQDDLDSVFNWIVLHKPGGIQFQNWDLDSVNKLNRKLKEQNMIQPFVKVEFFDYLGLTPYPFWEVSETNRKVKWLKVFEKDGINLIDLSRCKKTEKFTNWHNEWSESNLHQFILNRFDDRKMIAQYSGFENALRANKGNVYIDFNLLDSVDLAGFRRMYNFDNLLISAPNPEFLNSFIANGSDLVVINANELAKRPASFENWKRDFGNFNQAEFDASTRRILTVKSQLKDTVLCSSPKEYIESIQQIFVTNANAILNNKSGFLPLSASFTIFSSDDVQIRNDLRKKLQISTRKIDLNVDFDKVIQTKGNKMLIVPKNASNTLLSQIRNIDGQDQILVCFSSPDQYKKLHGTPLIAYFHYDSLVQPSYNGFVQQMVGGMYIDGGFFEKDSLIVGKKIKKKQLGISEPCFVGLSSDSLKKIDYLVRQAIAGRAFPGCQIIISKEGQIIYDKAFGHFTYDRVEKVDQQSMYDIASLTKVVATTLVGMKLYELGEYKLEDSLKDYLPDTLRDYLKFPSTLRHITFQELFTHQSGLPSGFPILPYMQYTSADVGRYDKYYCDRKDSVYCIPVADKLFFEKDFRDSMWIKMNQLWVDPQKSYRYSDVNMNLLYELFKHILHQNAEKYELDEWQPNEVDYFEIFLNREFYQPLGMNQTTYNPLYMFQPNQIVPTEKENFWRKQLLQGYVHDPNAALMGGIAGNAGIFSTTNDLAILGQMLLQNGTYGGKFFLKPVTINLFTNSQPNSWRGLGFNKPSFTSTAFGCADSAPPETYGHTGFTGTCIWMDPINEITYVFLSNRVHPNVSNKIYQYKIRSAIHQIVYDSRLF